MPDREWAKKNREKCNAYQRKYYWTNLKEKKRLKRYGDRKCRLCEIFLKSEYGGHKKKFYCDSCVERGYADKHARRLANRKFYYKYREEILAELRLKNVKATQRHISGYDNSGYSRAYCSTGA